MSTAPIGIGFVGLSATRGWAGTAHIPALAMLDNYEVRGLVGSSAQSAAAAASHFGVPFATDRVADLLARPDIDLVAVTVKVPDHFAVVKAALEAGKAVLCEWPLGRNVDEAQALTVLAQRQGVPAFVGLQARHSPEVRFVGDLIEQGYVGRVLSTTMIGAGGGSWGQPEIDPGQAYLQDRQSGATMLSITFGHAVDALCMLLGELTDPRALLAVRQPAAQLRGSGAAVTVSAPDQLVVAGFLDDGVVAAIHYRAGVRRGTQFHWEINGTEGSLVVSGASGHLQFGRMAVSGATGGATALAPLELPAGYLTVAGQHGHLGYNIALGYAAIARDLQTGSHTAPTFADALSRHRLLHAIELAAGY